MTPLCDERKSDIRRLVLLLTPVIMGFPAFAQPAIVPPPLSADEVISRVVEMNGTRARALEGYSSLRTYHLECHCPSYKRAEMIVRTGYQKPGKNEFTVVSKTGSGTAGDRVFQKLLEAEQESMQEENQQRSAITPANYTFQMAHYEKTDRSEFYVLDVQPRSRNKFLFRGRIWVDAKDFAITRVKGEPAVNPSWWTERTNFERRYRKIGDFWMPESNESETKVRAFGTAVLSIEYRDYQITPVRGTTFGYSQSAH